ncbi:unnamed protein product [Adineta steineri]|uniref:NHL repeat containing protein n=1 Tax=Adineta steineri TaxID=433720 RepID=A0A814X3T5_9BILA|nr:unnamed protein product [Adineta steineri]CAF1405751.1 unnamed protein product [Adineta steineri]
MNNTVGPDESVVVNSNTTGLQRLYEHFRKRKLVWIVFLVILIVVIIAVVTTTVLLNRTKREKTSTTEITTITTTSAATTTTTSAATTATATTTTVTTTITITTTTATTTSSTTTTSTTTTTSEQLVPSVMIDNNTKWKKDAVTVAGGHGPLGGLNQLNYPDGIYVDNDDQSIYIADTINHRIVRWESGANNGILVAGGNGPGSRIDQLNKPTDVILDKEKKYLIICNFATKQVMKWSLYSSSHEHAVMIRDITCWGLAMDNNGDLYVSEWEKHQVRRFYDGDRQGTVVAAGNGQGSQLNQLNTPHYIFVDKYHSVYIADYRNNRVMKWKKDATEGSLIAPGQVSDKNPNSLVQPKSVIVDHMGNIYVSNENSHQITRWSLGATEGTPVIGEKQSGNERTQLKMPNDLSFDQQGNLYVVDRNNHRIQKFAIDLD